MHVISINQSMAQDSAVAGIYHYCGGSDSDWSQQQQQQQLANSS
jgi:hypothetical protein